jgi:hypothetical protein
MVLKKPTSIGCRHLYGQIKHRRLQKEYVISSHAKNLDADEFMKEVLNMVIIKSELQILD